MRGKGPSRRKTSERPGKGPSGPGPLPAHGPCTPGQLVLPCPHVPRVAGGAKNRAGWATRWETQQGKQLGVQWPAGHPPPRVRLPRGRSPRRGCPQKTSFPSCMSNLPASCVQTTGSTHDRHVCAWTHVHTRGHTQDSTNIPSHAPHRSRPQPGTPAHPLSQGMGQASTTHTGPQRALVALVAEQTPFLPFSLQDQTVPGGGCTTAWPPLHQGPHRGASPASTAPGVHGQGQGRPESSPLPVLRGWEPRGAAGSRKLSQELVLAGVA